MEHLSGVIGTRRRKRRIAGHLEQAIRELALRDYSVAQIATELKRVGESDVPDLRTIRSIAAEVIADPSDPWTLRDADPASAGLVMPVLQAVIEQTGGRRQRVTSAQASWIAKLLQAAPDLTPWSAYVLASFYANHERLSQPTEHLDTFVAFAPWRSAAHRDRYLRAVPQIRAEFLSVVPNLLNGPSSPIHFKPIGPGEWKIEPAPTRARSRSRKKPIEGARG